MGNTKNNLLKTYIGCLKHILGKVQDLLICRKDFIEINQLYQSLTLKISFHPEANFQYQISISYKIPMKSKKDEGNDFFKKEKYQQAINSYTEYLKLDNPDNSKAYANMALSFFRLKKYEQCVMACESAVELEPENEKAQYRMYEAYKQLKDYYGMLISAQKFCKVSKDEKETTTMQKLIPKVKEELSYRQRKDNNNLESDKIMLQIVNQLKDCNDVAKPKKQPLICLQSKWQKIQQQAKESRRLALNQARRFLNQQCKTQQEKDKYKKLLPKLGLVSDNIKVDDKLQQISDKTESSEQDVKLEELKKYTDQKQKKTNQAQKNTNPISKNQSFTEQSKPKDQAILKLVPPKIQPIQQSLNKADQQKAPQKKPKQQQINKPEPQGKWEDFIKQEEAERLFQTHIKTKMSKYEDQFVGLYESLSSLLRSTELDRLQKEAILSLTPTKLKKFNMLMKSYTGKQKQQLAQLFIQNNLHTAMEKYSLKK